MNRSTLKQAAELATKLGEITQDIYPVRLNEQASGTLAQIVPVAQNTPTETVGLYVLEIVPEKESDDGEVTPGAYVDVAAVLHKLQHTGGLQSVMIDVLKAKSSDKSASALLEDDLNRKPSVNKARDDAFKARAEAFKGI